MEPLGQGVAASTGFDFRSREKRPTDTPSSFRRRWYSRDTLCRAPCYETRNVEFMMAQRTRAFSVCLIGFVEGGPSKSSRAMATRPTTRVSSMLVKWLDRNGARGRLQPG